MSTGQRAFGQAIVIGGSIAGLLSARVLADHFEKVVILERDPLPDGPEPRKSAPQGRHVHALLEAGLKVMEDLFPGLVQELERDGVDFIDMGLESSWFHHGSWKVRYESGIRTILCSRPHLEWKVRGRVTALPQVQLREGYTVEELLTDGSRERVTGVKVKGPDGAQTLQADLVVDASGRGSRAPQWLEALGVGPPEEEQVGVDSAYTSRFYERPAGFDDWKILAVYARAPENRRSGFVANVEGNRWIVSLNGYFGDHPPTDDEGFLEFARGLPVPHIHEAIRQARPLTQAVTYKMPASRWLHYERVARLPEGFVLLGDSVCAFNPLFGQGMTVISLGAQMLGECVAKQARSTPGDMRGLSRRFQKKLSGLIGLCWFLATTMDLRYPQARGKRPFGLGLLQWSVMNLIDLTSMDQKACQEFYKVLHMRGGLEVLLQPRLALSLLGYSLKSLFVPLERRANVTAPPPRPGQPAPGRDERLDTAA
ncbi:FAD-dependent oxidoreductase [Archangium sp.]|jgi:2-polyprenyl-6-methoxyphenol hydroxylase-like FAD-dependent oxidoreductase|uniref:FAD-dependent oxidoreductase n=1 Tax=Archangium sp. TaxID=1872627 RepID=UPI002ED8F011